jgi:hypothetical protein
MARLCAHVPRERACVRPASPLPLMPPYMLLHPRFDTSSDQDESAIPSAASKNRPRDDSLAMSARYRSQLSWR